MPPLLLHCCCAPCAAGCLERLQNEGRGVTFYFSNSNLDTPEEYARRLAALEQLAGAFRLPLLADAYDHAAWRGNVAGLENEPERGRRCAECFTFSLARTAAKARELGIGSFATTLTVSPHKNSRLIFDIGSRFDGFEAYDFKKQDGFKRSVELARELALYRQPYCGCEFSRREA